MPLPSEYQWLQDPALQPLPKVIQEALKVYGTHEVKGKGKGSNPTIIQWRDALKAAGVNVNGYGDDDVPWCGLFAAYICLASGKPVQQDPLWAQNWAHYASRSDTPSLGDILVFKRPGGGHVGFYVGETADCYLTLGGNTGDQVKIAPIEKARCIAVRRPPMTTPPASMRPFKIAKVGEAPSKNEA